MMTRINQGKWREWLKSLWFRLIEPAGTITNSHEQRSARLLALLLLSSLAILIVGRVLRPLLNLTELDISRALAWINILVLSVTYGLSRTTYYKLGAALTVLCMSVIIYVQVIYRAYVDVIYINYTAVWLIPLLFISSFVISARATLALVVGNLTALMMLPFLVPFITWLNVRPSLEIILVMSLLILLTTYIRRRDLDQIETQARQLGDSENRYRSLLEATSEGILLHDDGVTLDVNDALLNMFQYTLPEVIGRSVMDFIAPESHEIVWKNVGVRTPYELFGVRKDGTRFDMEVCVKLTNYQGRPVRVVTMEDITVRKQVDAHRTQLIAERERTNVLRRFLQDASHDLRTPLTTMNTSLYLLRRKSTDLDQVGEYVDTLDQQVEHLTELMDDLFVMLRLDDPDLYLARNPVNINRLVNDLAGDHRRIAAEKRQTLKFEPTADLPDVIADETELTRALTHIISNALIYTPPGGEIAVRTDYDDQQVIIEVEDNGIGIGSEELPHIFKRFYRADQARQKQGGHSGLGLAIAQRIVEIHDGAITVASQPNTGSTFQIRLPVSPDSLSASL